MEVGVLAYVTDKEHDADIEKKATDVIMREYPTAINFSTTWEWCMGCEYILTKHRHMGRTAEV